MKVSRTDWLAVRGRAEAKAIAKVMVAFAAAFAILAVIVALRSL